jgi:hypothetical protein
MKQHKGNKTNTLVRSQKRQKRKRRGSSTKEEEEDKVDDWQRRY